MISHAKISRHRRIFKTLTGLSMEGFKQILPFHHRLSGAPYPARSRLWIPSPARSSLKARFTASVEQPRDQGWFSNRFLGEWTYILGFGVGECRGVGWDAGARVGRSGADEHPRSFFKLQSDS